MHRLLPQGCVKRWQIVVWLSTLTLTVLSGCGAKNWATFFFTAAVAAAASGGSRRLHSALHGVSELLAYVISSHPSLLTTWTLLVHLTVSPPASFQQRKKKHPSAFFPTPVCYSYAGKPFLVPPPSPTGGGVCGKVFVHHASPKKDVPMRERERVMYQDSRKRQQSVCVLLLLFNSRHLLPILPFVSFVFLFFWGSVGWKPPRELKQNVPAVASFSGRTWTVFRSRLRWDKHPLLCKNVRQAHRCAGRRASTGKGGRGTRFQLCVCVCVSKFSFAGEIPISSRKSESYLRKQQQQQQVQGEKNVKRAHSWRGEEQVQDLPVVRMGSVVCLCFSAHFPQFALAADAVCTLGAPVGCTSGVSCFVFLGFSFCFC